MKQSLLPNAFDSGALADRVRLKRGDQGLRAAVKEIGGVSTSTLSRIENGHVPDLDTYIRLCRWLGVSPDSFIASEQESDEQSTPDAVAAHFRADRALDPQTAESLSAAMRALYQAAIEGKL